MYFLLDMDMYIHQKEKGYGKHKTEDYDYYGTSGTHGYLRCMRGDLTARFDYATGWSYLFIVYRRSGCFGQSGRFGHVTVNSHL